MEKLNPVVLAMIPAVFGLLLVIAASSTSHSGVIRLIGVIGIAKGVLIYANPGGCYEKSKQWLFGLTDQGYRLVGIVALVLGTVVISWIQ